MRIGLITYAHPEPFHTAQMDVVAGTLAALGTKAEVSRHFGCRDKALLAAEAERLTAWEPDLIVSFMTNADIAVIAATVDTPIVCWSMDPIDSGLVKAMARPGGRLTGVAFPPGLQMMQLRALKMLKPATQRVAMLFNPGYAPAAGSLAKLAAAGGLFGIEIVAYEALTLEAVRAALPAMAADGCGGLVVGPHELFNQNGLVIGRLALECGLPTVAMDNIVECGGTVSFMPDFPRIWDAAARIANRILKGEAPGAIPFDRHIKPRVTLNLDAARQLGLLLDPIFVDEADRLIGVGGE
ncbi:ABC transporter substrate-binding protein [Sphingomonas sp.]|uniref:ABC transporter substrate-binding protein n=1 Tax=Sphingomonas sp. TaxID=28214 RepID=UPI002EDB80A4